MDFVTSVQTCLRKYATFEGRANRPEFWWFILFCIICSMIGSVLAGDRGSALVTLVLLLPTLAVSARRLHDIGKSGWWQLLGIIPIVGFLVLLYWFVQPTREPVESIPV